MSYDELLRLRDAAAPLPWEGVKVDDLNCFVRTATGGCAAEIYGVWANAAYLFAAANAVPGLVARIRELEAKDAEWWRAARTALAGHLDPPHGWNDGDPLPEPDTTALYELYRGRGWTDQPACALEIAVRENERMAARVRELEAVTPPELDDARPCPCCWPGCDGNADPRCRYRLCGTHCDADCGRGDKCPRSDAKREGA